MLIDPGATVTRLKGNARHFAASFREEAPVEVVDGATLADPDHIKEWTVLVWADGRNGLAPSTLRALREMEKVGSDERVSVVAHVTSQATMGDRHLEQLGRMPTRTVYVTAGGNSPVIAEAATCETPTVEAVANFLAMGMEKFPARSYLVLFKQHGLGFAAAGDTVPLSARDLDQALDKAETRTGKRVGVLATDSCLMQQAEVGYQLRHRADVLTGSPENILAREYPYQTLLESLKRISTLPADQQTPQLVGKVIARIHEKEVPRGIQTAVDLSKMEDFGKATRGLVDALIEEKVPRDLIYTHLIRSQTLDPYNPEGFSYDFRDLGGFLKGLAEDGRIASTRVKEQVAATRATLEGTVLAHAIHPTKTRIMNSTGPSAYLPWRHPGQAVADGYAELDFAKDTGWNRLIDYLFDPQSPGTTPAPVAGTAVKAGLFSRLGRTGLFAYKKYISPYTPSTCPYTPSCSQYSREAMETHGFVEAVKLTAMRLLGCSAEGAGGEDPVPPITRDDHADHGEACPHHHHEGPLPELVLTPPDRHDRSPLRQQVDRTVVGLSRLTGRLAGGTLGLVLGAPAGLAFGAFCGFKAGLGTLDAMNGAVIEKYGQHKGTRLIEVETPVAAPGDWVNEQVMALTASPLAARVLGTLAGTLAGGLIGLVGGAIAGWKGASMYTGILAANVSKDALGLLPRHYKTEQILTRDYRS